MRRIIWGGLLLLLSLATSACGDPTSKIAYSDLPPNGDPVQGEILFNQRIRGEAACVECHVLTTVDRGSPALRGFGEFAATRVAGMSAHEYAFYSIVEPARFLVEGFGNAMPNKYDDKMTPKQVADLIAYLLTL